MSGSRRGFFGKMIGLVATPIIAQALPAPAPEVKKVTGPSFNRNVATERSGTLTKSLYRSTGTSGQVLTSQGDGLPSIWIDPEQKPNAGYWVLLDNEGFPVLVDQK